MASNKGNASRFATRLRRRVNAKTEDMFRKKVYQLHSHLNKVRAVVRKHIKEWLRENQGNTIGGSKIPRVRTGNLVRKSTLIKMNKKPTFNSNRQAEIEVANLVDGGSRMGPFVKNRGANYLRILNESSKFKEYNGFVKQIHREFKERFTEEFQTYRF